MDSLTRRQWLGAAAALPLSAAPARRPNVLLIMSDDQGYGDLSLHGNPHLKTPNLDRLAREGVEFTRFYVSPVCAPTRAALLTGRYNVRCGVHGVTGGRETMPTDEVTIAEAFHAAGYRTALFGKWHLGEHYPYVPHAQGFDEFVGFRTGHWMNYFDPDLERNGKPIRAQGYITDVFTNEALAFLEKNRAEPFFLYLAYNAPHSPFQVPESYYAAFRGLDLPGETKAVYAMVSNLDENIGRLMAGLGRLGLAENTIVVFLTDNGPNGQRYNAGLRANKGAIYEGGLRAPLFVRWPGRWKAGRQVDRIAAHIDLYPTLTEACGVTRPKGRAIDGVGLVPLLEGGAPKWPDRMLYSHRERPQQPDSMYPGAVRTQRFSLINGEELYDLSADPGERENVAAKFPDQHRELRAAYENWFRGAIAERGFHHFPIPVGYAEENPVSLPAPQSYFSGGLKFHGGAGYAHDWVTGWTNEGDSVWWEIDVVRAGAYGVALKYLCPAADVGARVAVSAGGAIVEAAVREATPMERFLSRAIVPENSYPIMHWATLPMGSLKLPAGKTRLTVKALSKTGRVVMELKEVVLSQSR